MPADLNHICEVLKEESRRLFDVLTQLSEPQWLLPTPSPGWRIQDQVTHLAYYDDATTVAFRDPARFRAELEAGRADEGSAHSMPDQIAERYRDLGGPSAFSWLQKSRPEVIASALSADPALRAPWFGPSMSVPSLITARIMETWAHGQDIYDTLGITPPQTKAVGEVCFIGLRALPNAFRANDIDVPQDPVCLELELPDGSPLLLGDPEAHNRVLGTAIEFALVVTQRIHLADTDLVVKGDVAALWLTIAQAFAGTPGTGREPRGRRE